MKSNNNIIIQLTTARNVESQSMAIKFRIVT